MKVGIIGATGWLGSATGAKLLAQGIVSAPDLVLLNRSGTRTDYHGHTDVVWASDAVDLVARCDVVILAVRPADFPALRLDATGKLVISFMAGVGMDRLTACGGRVVRSMPNAAIEIGASYSPWLAGPRVTAEDRDRVRTILGALGTEDELTSEDQIDLMTAAPGAGAAYPALMLTTVQSWLVNRGLDADVAWRAAEGMVCAGARLLEGRGDTAPALVAAYRDYAGTTAAGLEAAEAAGFSASLEQAFDAALMRAREMSADS